MPIVGKSECTTCANAMDATIKQEDSIASRLLISRNRRVPGRSLAISRKRRGVLQREKDNAERIEMEIANENLLMRQRLEYEKNEHQRLMNENRLVRQRLEYEKNESQRLEYEKNEHQRLMNENRLVHQRLEYEKNESQRLMYEKNESQRLMYEKNLKERPWLRGLGFTTNIMSRSKYG